MAAHENSIPVPFAPEPDAALRRRFHEGNPESMEQIAALFFSDVRRYALVLLRDDDRAHEALQDTFLRVVERHRLYRPDRLFRPWLFAVCRNCCLTHLRQDQRDRGRVLSLETTEFGLEQMASELPRAEEHLLRGERERETLALLAPLPELSKTIIILHLFEELTFRQVGEIVGIPPATVSTNYYRTLAALREQLMKDPRKMEGSGHARR